MSLPAVEVDEVVEQEPHVLSATAWPTNADMIADVAKLGYLRKEWITLDPTYGLGTWWRKWKPNMLWACDLHPHPEDEVGYPVHRVDFRWLPFPADTYDAVVFDPPYKMNGTPTPDVDDRYGVGKPTSWKDRLVLMQQGLKECFRVCRPGGYVLAKCQDQVVSGRVVWQTNMLADLALDKGHKYVDRLDMLRHRPQPAGRRQVHAHRNYSTLLIFEKGKS